MSAKPILIVKLPSEHFHNSTDFDRVKKALDFMIDDYHILVIANREDEISFEVFYEKDYKPIDYEGLKKLIEEARP
jgi:hypothetical protein